jgi:hypothetical protein
MKTGNPQAGEAVPIDQALPVEEFLARQLVAFTRLFEGKNAIANGIDNRSLAPNNPPLGICGRQQALDRELIDE